MVLKIHIVQKGDTLWKIAKKYGVDFEELKKMNSQLSNPDMIMPGMKIKVPTAGVSVKKEGTMGTAGGGMKEMPITEHPFGNQTKTYPVTEIDEELAPAPLQPMPTKEMPVPKKEVPVVPKMPVLPKLPPIQPIKQEVDIMNTDINTNFYTLNMALPQKPPEVPKPVAPAKEEPVMEESPEELVMPMMPHMPAYMPTCVPVHPTCIPVPITPVMPGYGYNFVPCVPCPPGAMPVQPMYTHPMYQQAPMMPQQAVHGAQMMPESPEVMGMQEMESEENMSFGEMNVAPSYSMPTADMPAYQQPMYQQPMYQQPMYQQPMYQQPMYQQPMYQQPMYQQPMYQQPMYQQPAMMPQQEVQGAQIMEESPEMSIPQGYQAAPYIAPQSMYDCGCGGPQPYYPQPVPYAMPQAVQPAPYGYAPYTAAPYGMMGGYMPQMGMAQPYMQPRVGEDGLFDFPDFDDDDTI
jgi:morphogenetic protein associated with SpoVID